MFWAGGTDKDENKMTSTFYCLLKMRNVGSYSCIGIDALKAESTMSVF